VVARLPFHQASHLALVTQCLRDRIRDAGRLLQQAVESISSMAMQTAQRMFDDSRKRGKKLGAAPSRTGNEAGYQSSSSERSDRGASRGGQKRDGGSSGGGHRSSRSGTTAAASGQNGGWPMAVARGVKPRVSCSPQHRAPCFESKPGKRGGVRAVSIPRVSYRPLNIV